MKRRPCIAALAAAAFGGAIFASSALAAGARPFVRGSWSDIRAAHAGRPTIVHVWGLSCGPCLAELPEWAAFIRRHPGIDFVLVNADRNQDRASAAVSNRLTKAGLGGVEAWAFADTYAERLRFEIDPDWQGEMPYTITFARDGSRTAFSGSADFQALAKWAADSLPAEERR